MLERGIESCPADVWWRRAFSFSLNLKKAIKIVQREQWKMEECVFPMEISHQLFSKLKCKQKKLSGLVKKKYQTQRRTKNREVQGLCVSRSGWDHYKSLLCHCQPALVNPCQGHTYTVLTHPHTHSQTSHLHSYCHIYSMLTNSISHIPLNWKVTHMHHVSIH